MKKCYSVLSLLFVLLVANLAFAQRVVPVPSLTTDALFNAISTAAAGDILELESGGTYPNIPTLTTTVPITIRTAPGFTNKARVVYAANSTGGYAGNMFSIGANITIQNVIFDLKQGTVQAWGGVWLSRIATGITGGKIFLDGVEVYRPGGLSSGGTFDTLIVRNCYFLGHIKNGGGWGVPFSVGKSEVKCVEFTNNTFVFCIFAGVITDGGFSSRLTTTIDKLILDHNTFYCIDGSHGPANIIVRVKEVVITNNIYYNPSFRPLEFFSDKYLDFPENEDVFRDSITIKVLGPKGLWVIVLQEGDSAKTNLTMEANNIVWSSDILKAWSDRDLKKPWFYTNETKRFIKDTNTATFSEEVKFTNAPAVPMTIINSIADTVINRSKDIVRYAKTTPFNGVLWYDPTTKTPLYDFKVKDSVDMSYQTTAKSYKAGVYSTEMKAIGLKGASGYPLGDLNWFPTLKVNWEAGIPLSVHQQEGVPVNFELAQNYPNPFNPKTNINFSIQQSGLVTLKVFNALGQEVATLINQNMQPGKYSVDFDASGLSSGVYIYKFNAGSFTSSKKMTLVR